MKYDVYAIYTVTTYIGEFEADSREAAIDAVECSEDFQYNIGPCCHCSKDVGDSKAVHCEIRAEEVV